MIAITGTSGFVGKSLVNKIKTEYMSLTYDENEWKIKQNKVNHNSEISASNLSKIETLIHLGSFVPKKSDEINLWKDNLKSILSTHKLLSLNLPNLKKIIYVSSSRASSWDPMESTKINSNSRTIYGAAKYISENLVKVHAENKSINFTIIRPGSLYGPGEDKFNRLIPNFIKSALANEPLYVSDNKNVKLSFLYIEDLVNIIVLISLGKQQKSLIKLEGHEFFTLTEIANKILSITNSKSQIIYYRDSKQLIEEVEDADFEKFEFTNFLDGLKSEINSFA
jgi:UDP-glucose 4-epimerase